jgi:hypothetical protein
VRCWHKPGKVARSRQRPPPSRHAFEGLAGDLGWWGFPPGQPRTLCSYKMELSFSPPVSTYGAFACCQFHRLRGKGVVLSGLSARSASGCVEAALANVDSRGAASQSWSTSSKTHSLSIHNHPPFFIIAIAGRGFPRETLKTLASAGHGCKMHEIQCIRCCTLNPN